MISVALLLKMVGAICFIGCWAYMLRAVRRIERRMACLTARYEGQPTAPTRDSSVQAALVPEDAERAESRQKALEAERLFTEGIANILSFAHTSIGVCTPQGVCALKDEPAASDRVARKCGE